MLANRTLPVSYQLTVVNISFTKPLARQRNSEDLRVNEVSLLHFVLDITKSVAHHGFDRILVADGHGSNMPILDLVARRTVLETDALCGCFIWPSLAADEIRKRRESGRGVTPISLE